MQFGALSADADATLSVKECSLCGSRFSGDARFCPFDGERLAGTASKRTVDPLVGTVVDGRYTVTGVLGEGGMGKVYEVRHRLLERVFAMKVLRADLAREAELAQRFMREAKAAAAVSHPNVVHITDFGQLPTGQPFFVMERLRGVSLSALLRSGPLPESRAVPIVTQVALALGAAHDAGIVHRDLKPDNVFIGDGPGGDEVKVLDFGLAQVAGQSRLTKDGMVFGTPHYMSPEQASGNAVDHRADMYSLGVVAYEILTGKVPFEADTFMGVMTQHMYVAPVPPHELLGRAELGVLETITLRCLEKKPDHRFTDMKELVSALRRASAAIEAPSGEVARREEAAREVARREEPPRVQSVLADVLGSPRSARVALPDLPLDRWSRRSMLLGGGALVVVLAWVGAYFAFRPAAEQAPAIAPAPSATHARLPPAPASVVTSPTAVATAPAPDLSAEAPPAPTSERKRVRKPVPDRPKPRILQKSLGGGEILDPWSQ